MSPTRHLAQQLFGTAPLYRHFSKVGGSEVSLLGRSYLAELVRSRTGLKYNETKGNVLLINSRVNPLVWDERWTSLNPESAVIDHGEVAVASVRSGDLERLVSSDGTIAQARLSALVKDYERLEANAPVMFAYAWDLLEANSDAIRAASKGPQEKPMVSGDAEVEEMVHFDTRHGPVIVAEDAYVEAFSRISGPCYIGKGVALYSAQVRGGTTIDEGCKVGGEVGQSIIYRRSNKAHFGYLGHSIVGEWVNIGAGAVTSDLKNTYGTVRVAVGDRKVDSGLIKLGTMIGDAARVSIGSMLYSGKTLGVAARCSGNVDREVPDFTEYDGVEKTTTSLDLEKVLAAHQRMKARRDEELTPQERAVLHHVYAGSAKGPAAS